MTTRHLIGLEVIRPRPNAPVRCKGKRASSLAVHVVLTFLLIKFSLFLGCGILVLLVLTDQIVHVTFCFGKFHFVHTFTCVPMQECLASEHSCEVLSHTLEHLLNGGGIA